MAASGSQNAAAIALATNQPVVTIGGFTGSDPAPTAKQIDKLVRSGQLRYVLLDSQRSGRPGAGGSGASTLATWVTSHGIVVNTDTSAGGGQTLYRLVSSS